MSDIDFDELDRAVASVLNGSSTKSATPAPATPTAPVAAEPVIEPYVAPAPEPVAEAPVVEAIPEPVVPVEAPSVEETASEVVAQPEPALVEMPVPEELKAVAPAAQALHPVTAKPVQRGRFLDMVHPSQDMGPRAAISVTPRPAVPVAAQVANQTFVSDIVAPKPETSTATDPVSAPAPEAPASADTTVSEELEDTVDANDFFGGTPAEGSKVDEPNQSPFIADAKVEKRPLGAFTSDSGPLPVGEELHDRLVQVESEENVIETAESPIPGAVSAPTPAAKKDTPVVASPTPAIVTVDSVTKADDKTAQKLSSKSSAIATPKVKMPSHGHGNAIRITVAIAVLLIGFGVGATLYFVVLH